LKATDLDASIAFYRDVVGLNFLARFDPPGIAFFDTGGPRLYLAAALPEGTLYFAVEHLEAAVADLESRGISLLQKPTMVHRDDAGQFGRKGVEEWMAFFRDPSGNTVALVERR
jgi:catechol 2,3-dioxygenase-like lactoylglutathione lyase family enzyme